MKLISCHIENFGKLSGQKFDFSDGLNILHEANAWGKSTLAAFLRVMFYGFDSKKESGAFEKERVIYRPWQGGTFGGEVEFEYQGKRYRMTRTFGKTEKTDSFHLYDLSTNLESHDFSSEVGNEIFGLDSASFKRTAFIAQNDCECGSTDAINAKLGNLVENTNDINNFETAQKRIHDRLNKLSMDRATGSMKKRKNAITLLSDELLGFAAAEEAAKELEQKLKEKQEMKKELSDIRGQYAQALQVASEESRRESLKENYDSLCKEVEEKQALLKQYEALFPNRVPSEEEFKRKNQEVQMLGMLKTTLYNIGLSDTEQAQYQRLHDMFKGGVPSEQKIAAMDENLDRLARCKDERSQLESKMSYYEALAMKQEELPALANPKKGMKLIGLVGVILAILGAVAGWFLSPGEKLKLMVVGGCGVVLAVSLLLLLLRVILVRRAKKALALAKEKQEIERKKLNEPVEEIHGQLAEVANRMQELRTQVRSFLETYHIFCDVDEAKSKLYDLRTQIYEYNRLQMRFEKSSEAQKNCDSTRTSLMGFGQEVGIDFGEDIAASLSELQTKAAEYRLAKSALETAQEKKKSFEAENPVDKLNAVEKCPYSLDQLNTMIRDVDDKIEAVRESIEQYTHQMEDLQEQLDLRDEKAGQLALYEEEQALEMESYEILSLTQSFLQNAKDEFAARYLGPIEQGFGKYYELLTKDTGKGWMVNANIDVKLKEQGELRETKWLSAGYQDLLGVCMRLALVDAMYPEEKPFLILDDPYVNLDEEKVACGNELLQTLSEEYQVIYFTCHDSRVGNTSAYRMITK